VLHHADRPSLYHGLPENPKISAMVSLWKGLAKPLALAGIAFAAVAGFFHYTRVGPNEVTEEDEAVAQREADVSARGTPRPVRRRSEAFGEGGRRLGDGVIDPDCVGPSADRGRPFAVGFGPCPCRVDRTGGTVVSAL